MFVSLDISKKFQLGLVVTFSLGLVVTCGNVLPQPFRGGMGEGLDVQPVGTQALLSWSAQTRAGPTQCGALGEIL